MPHSGRKCFLNKDFADKGGNKIEGKKAIDCANHVLDSIFYSFHHRIIQYGLRADRCGFPMCKLVRPIDVRITISNGRIIMKIRDYCPKFDMTQRIKMVANDDDPTKHIGTKIVSKTAHTINYVNLLNANTLLVEI